jgi:multidrug efflux pump subunit AcrB
VYHRNKHYAALGGLNAVNFATKSNSATIFVQLKPWDERKDEKDQLDGVIATLQKKLAKFKEASVVVISPPAIPGLGNTGGFSFILQEKEAGGDIKNFEKVLNTFVAAINNGPKLLRRFVLYRPYTGLPVNY